MRARTLLPGICAALGLSITALSQSKIFYKVTALGAPGGPPGAAAAINIRGQVVGFAQVDTNTTRGFLYGTARRDLGGGSSAAYAINDWGTAVGVSDGYPCVFFAGRVVRMPITVSQIEGGEAHSINNLGVIAGALWAPVGALPFIQVAGATTLISVGDRGIATHINDRNHVAGYAFGVGGSQRAFFYDGETRFLGDLGGLTEALSINDRDEIVGRAEIRTGSDSYMRGFLYRGGAMAELATIGLNSVASGINNRSEIVGWTGDSVWDPSVRRGVIWKNGAVYDLNNLLEANSRGDWVVTEARDINVFGQIAAQGYSPSHGIQALRLDPSN